MASFMCAGARTPKCAISSDYLAVVALPYDVPWTLATGRAARHAALTAPQPLSVTLHVHFVAPFDKVSDKDPSIRTLASAAYPYGCDRKADGAIHGWASDFPHFAAPEPRLE